MEKPLTIKGIEMLTVAGLLTEAGDIGCFQSPNQIQKLVAHSSRLTTINKAKENVTEILKEILFKTGDLRGIGNFVKAAEFTQMS